MRTAEVNCQETQDLVHGCIDGEPALLGRLEIERHIDGSELYSRAYRSKQDLKRALKAGPISPPAPAIGETPGYSTHIEAVVGNCRIHDFLRHHAVTDGQIRMLACLDPPQALLGKRRIHVFLDPLPTKLCSQVLVGLPRTSAIIGKRSGSLPVDLEGLRNRTASKYQKTSIQNHTGTSTYFSAPPFVWTAHHN
jgi:hypothetical protein